jgi:penicillin amidase
VRSYAIRWTGADRRSGIESLLELQRATSWSEFRAALRSYASPPATFLYADVDGAIGTQVAGRLPVRPIDTQLLPVAAEYDWTGFVPFESLPSRSGAELPWAAVSLQGDGSAFGKPTEWLWPDGHAADRVRQRLRDAKKLGLSDVLELQRERVSADGPQRVRALLGSVQGRTKGGQRVRELLLEWDGGTGVDSVGAAVYHVFREQLAEHLLRARFSDAPALIERIGGAEPVPGVLLDRFLDRAIEEAGTAERTSQNGANRERRSAGSELVADALEESWTWLATQWSTNPRRWLWGELRRVRFAHAFELLGEGSLHWVGTLFGVGPLRVPGDPDSPWTMHHRALGGAPSAVGPALRYTIDLADVYHARIELAGGQSGHPGSANYRDGLDEWLRARPRLLRTHPSDIEDNAIGVWRIEPPPAGAAP